MRTPDGARHFLLNDQLGSTTTVMNMSGASESTQKYYPFGGTRPVSTLNPPTDKLYTGHQKEGSLYFMQARFYDPALGRFLQPDSIVPQPGNPQSMNRYSYVYNNPLKYLELTGQQGVPFYCQYYCPTEDELNAAIWESAVGAAISDNPELVCQNTGIGCDQLLDALEWVGTDPFYCPLTDPHCISKDEARAANDEWRAGSESAIEYLLSAGMEIERLPWTGDQCSLLASYNQRCKGLLELGREDEQYYFALLSVAVVGAGKPVANVTNSSVKSLLAKVFRPTDTIPGGTAGAIRYELRTGQQVGGRWHSTKGVDSINEIDNILAARTLSLYEKNLLNALRLDLVLALNGY